MSGFEFAAAMLQRYSYGHRYYISDMLYIRIGHGIHQVNSVRQHWGWEDLTTSAVRGERYEVWDKTVAKRWGIISCAACHIDNLSAIFNFTHAMPIIHALLVGHAVWRKDFITATWLFKTIV